MKGYSSSKPADQLVPPPAGPAPGSRRPGGTAMTDLVNADAVEGIVGMTRHPTAHYARAVSAEQRVYILHSRQCLGDIADLRECAYSVALDRGIDVDEWAEDTPLRVMLSWGDLVPLDPEVQP